MHTPVVTIVSGPTGAGKTTWSAELAEQCGGLRFSIDEWMAQLFAADRAEPQLAWMLERIARCETMIWATCTQALGRGTDVVLDLGFSQRAHREKFRAMAESAGADSVTHWVDADPELRRVRTARRNLDRGATFAIEVTPAMFDMMEARTESLTPAERARSTVVSARPEGSISVRAEGDPDAAAVHEVLLQAFGAPGEAEIVARLRGSEEDGVRLVALLGARVVGHVQMSRVRIGAHVGVGLGPVAVHPDDQRRGIGHALVTEALARSAGRGEPFAVVLGAPAYYGRFGFAHHPEISCVYGAPASAFQAQALCPGGLQGVAGRAAYAPVFGGPAPTPATPN